MRPGSRDRILTVDDAVASAAQMCDPEQASEGVTGFVSSFEDDERPATSVDDLRGELASAAREIDPEGDDPAVAVTAATASWLATNPGDVDDPERAIREGARLYFRDSTPEAAGRWLQRRGLS